eukprot:scaffold32948_cov43-Prasinocladus_malaysianus.AAC.1
MAAAESFSATQLQPFCCRMSKVINWRQKGREDTVHNQSPVSHNHQIPLIKGDRHMPQMTSEVYNMSMYKYVVQFNHRNIFPQYKQSFVHCAKLDCTIPLAPEIQLHIIQLFAVKQFCVRPGGNPPDLRVCVFSHLPSKDTQ